MGPDDVTKENLEKMRPVLAKWLPLVKVYDSDSPKTALLNGDVDLGVVWSGEAAILIKEQPEKFAYVLPKEGAHMFIDSLAHPEGRARTSTAAHKFINYILRPEVSKQDLRGVPLHEPERRGAQAAHARGAREPGQLPARQPEALDLPRHRPAGGRRRQAVHRPEGEERVLGAERRGMRQEATSFAAAAGPQRSPGRAGWLLLAPLILWAAGVRGGARRSSCSSTASRSAARSAAWCSASRSRTTPASSTRSYLRIVIRSIVYAALTTAICLAAGYPVAYLIGRADERWRNLLLMAVMVPFWTSFLIRTYAWVTILKSEGLLNSLLLQLQLIAEPLEMLYTPGAVMLGLVYTFLPFMILPIYSSVEKLDGALIEAALDLGAGPLRAFSRVIVPLTSPGHRGGRAAGVRARARHLRRERHPGRRPRGHDRQHHREPVQGQRAQLAVRRRARHHAAGQLRGRSTGFVNRRQRAAFS